MRQLLLLGAKARLEGFGYPTAERLGKKRMMPKPGRGGRALLAGLVRCRRCGRMLQVDYGGGGPNREARSHRYLCRGDAINFGEAGCISFGGLRPDQAVSSMLLDVVQPTAIEAAVEAAARVLQEDVDEVRAVSLELEQAGYEAGLASRRYEAVDPENRLVAGELEVRWNAAMARVRELESRLEEARQRPKPMATVDRKTLLSLAMNLPAVWNSEAADMLLKQRIVRTVIQEIVADVDESASEIVFMIHWVGGPAHGGTHTEGQGGSAYEERARCAAPPRRARRPRRPPCVLLEPTRCRWFVVWRGAGRTSGSRRP